jgi:taurine dioxygenase
MKITPLHEFMGAEISDFDINSPSENDIEQMIDALSNHGMIRIRGQQFTDHEHLLFMRHFGELELSNRDRFITPGTGWFPQFPQLSCVSNIIENGQRVGGCYNDELEWHSDTCHQIVPCKYTSLHAVEISDSTQGPTHYCSMYKALDVLPDELKGEITGKLLYHGDYVHATGTKHNVKSDEFTDIGHPIIQIHPVTGRNVLYLGRRNNAEIVGMPEDESNDILDQIFTIVFDDQYIFSHNWEVDDLVIWDNNNSMHHRKEFPNQIRRRLHKTFNKGDKSPIAEKA